MEVHSFLKNFDSKKSIFCSLCKLLQTFRLKSPLNHQHHNQLQDLGKKTKCLATISTIFFLINLPLKKWCSKFSFDSFLVCLGCFVSFFLFVWLSFVLLCLYFAGAWGQGVLEFNTLLKQNKSMTPCCRVNINTPCAVVFLVIILKSYKRPQLWGLRKWRAKDNIFICACVY